MSILDGMRVRNGMWWKEPPTVPGFYWVRNLVDLRYDRVHPTIIELTAAGDWEGIGYETGFFPQPDDEFWSERIMPPTF